MWNILYSLLTFYSPLCSPPKSKAIKPTKPYATTATRLVDVVTDTVSTGLASVAVSVPDRLECYRWLTSKVTTSSGEAD